MLIQSKLNDLFTTSTNDILLEQNKVNLRISFIFYVYNILINIFGLFYTNLFTWILEEENNQMFNLSQKVTNYSYNGLCIILSIFFLSFFKNLSEGRIRDINHFYFIIKINIDFFNFFYLTPTSFKYSQQLNALYYLLIPFNYILYHTTCKTKQVSLNFMTICLFVLALISSLICYLQYTNGNLFEALFYEISKLTIYFFIFIHNLNLQNQKKFENKFYTTFKNLQNLNMFLFSSFENSKSTGIIIYEDSEKIYNNYCYFENLIVELLNLGENSNFKTYQSYQKKSFKLSNYKEPKAIDVTNYSNNFDINNLTKRKYSFNKKIYENTNNEKMTNGYKALNRPFSSKNVINNFNNFGDFKTKPIKSKNFSSNSLKQYQNEYLDDIKEEKDENEMSIANLKGTKKSGSKRYSIDSNKVLLNASSFLNTNSEKKSDRYIYKSSNLDFNNNIKKKSNKILEVSKERKYTQPIQKRDIFLKTLDERISAERKKEINAIFDDIVESNASSLSVSKDLIHEIQSNVLDIFKERNETEFIELKVQKRSESNKLNSTKLMQKIDEAELNTMNIRNFRKKSSKFYKKFKEEKDNDSSQTDSDSLFEDKHRKYKREYQKNSNTVKLLENLEKMSGDEKKDDINKNFPKKLKIHKSGNYLNIYKEKGSSTDENVIDIKSNILSTYKNVNTVKLLERLDDYSKNQSGYDSQIIEKIPTTRREHKIESFIETSGNNLINFNDFSKYLVENTIPGNKLSTKNVIVKIPNIQNLTNDDSKVLYGNNFLQSLSNHISANNLQLLVTNHTMTPLQIQDPKYDYLRNAIVTFNKTIQSGILLPEFLKQIVKIFQNDASLTDALEFGIYNVSLVDFVKDANKDECQIEVLNLNKKPLRFNIRPVHLNQKVYYVIYVTEFISLANNHSYIRSKRSTLKNMQSSASLGRKHNSIKKTKFQVSDVENHNNYYNNAFVSDSSTNKIYKIIPKPKSTSLLLGDISINNQFNAKVSALLHDFKHLIIDNQLFNENIFTTYQINLNEEDKLYYKVMNEYTHSLILNITNFMKDPESFFKGTLSDNSQTVDLPFILDTMTKIFNRRLKWENETCESIGQSKRNLNISFKMKDNNPNHKKIKSNKNLLISLLYNILSNSFKATKEGEITIELSTLNDYELMIKIIDTGKGIPDSVLKNWSKPFNMDKSTQNIKLENGTGLGQFIMAAISKSLKYELPLPEKNPAGTGTIFKIVVPINPGTTTKNISFLSGSHASKKQFGQQKVSDKENNTNSGAENDEIAESHEADTILYVQELTPFNITTYNVLCLDDDPIIINTIVHKLKQKLSSLERDVVHFEFEICYTFESFYEHFSKFLMLKKHYHFFILDQNISIKLKGVDIAELIHQTYSTFFDVSLDIFYNFIFVTEQSDSLKTYFEKKNSNKSLDTNKVFLNENVFGKTEYELLSNKLINLVSADICKA